MKLNCDLGEADKLIEGCAEYVAMPHIDMANIACGFHAGNRQMMKDTIALAKKYGVAVGAHPSYPDRENFGRISFSLNRANICDLVLQQSILLEALCEDQGIEMAYVKPHGALYHDMMQSDEVLFGIFDAVDHLDRKVPIVLMATPYNERYKQKAQQAGHEVIFEAFADRRYNEMGLLQDRSTPGAVYTDGAEIIQQAINIASGKPILTASGKEIILDAQTICVHGDNPESIASIIALREALNASAA